MEELSYRICKCLWEVEPAATHPVLVNELRKLERLFIKRLLVARALTSSATNLDLLRWLVGPFLQANSFLLAYTDYVTRRQRPTALAEIPAYEDERDSLRDH